MAAGDIIIPNNTITPEIMQQIATEVEKLIGTNAKDPGQWETVQSTDGVTSLPVFKVIGNTYKLVRVAVSILQGIDGREVELRLNTDRTAIQWRYVGVSGSNLDPTEWVNLVDLSLIKGDPGENPVFRKGTSGLEWKYQSESDSSWRLLVSIDDIKLHFSDLTEDEIAEFWRGVPEDVVALFQKPATDAAAEVREQMNEVTQNVNKAIGDIRQLETTVEGQEEARESFYSQAQTQEQNRQTKEAERQKAAEEQAAAAEEQAEAAATHAKAEEARVLADSERDKTFTTRMQEITTATQNADTAAETAEESAKEADKQALAAKGAAADAQDTADHPTYIGADYHVYKWNKGAKAYDKTDIFVKGDAFSIKKVYPSISAMNADLDNPEIKEGDFVLINTNDVENPDNAQLYIRTETGFRFLVDMSGAIGFTGKTPQFGIGNVTLGEANVTISEDGVDSNGNPKYKLNFVIERGPQGFTPIIQGGNIETGSPDSEVSLVFTKIGETDAGEPIYEPRGSIPKGEPGKGSGNVSAEENGLIAGKKYLFVPTSDNSAVGTFVEYTTPVQVQSDWTVTNTELPSFIKNKPTSMPASDVPAWAKAATKPAYTASEVGALPSGGTAVAANKLATPRTINGVSFDGTENINITAPASDVSAWAKASTKPTYTASEVGALPSGGTAVSANKTTGTLTINGTAFNGSSNVSITTPNTTYSQATSSTLGLVKIGYPESGKNYPVELNSSGQMFVNVPWENTTYGVATTSSNGLMSSGDKSKLDGIATGANNYSLPQASSSTRGGVLIGYSTNGKNYAVTLDSSGKMYVNVPWTDTNTTYGLATTSVNGLLRQLNGSTSSFMRGDGTWATPPNTTYSTATQSTNGLMSSADKTKLDKVDSYATASSISNLDVTKKVIYVALTANGSLSANNAGAAYNGQSFSVKIYCSSARTITIPTSGNYVSMCGSSYTCPAGKRVEFHFEGINGQWWIAKLEQE